MSHVVSSQPSSTSPYQPTEIQETTNGNNRPRIVSTGEAREGQNDCCFRADKSHGCFLYYCCNFLSSVCGAIRDCTEGCCNWCADCLNDCCEDKPDDKKRRRNRNSSNSNDYDDNTWVVGATQHYDSAKDNDYQGDTLPMNDSVPLTGFKHHDADTFNHTMSVHRTSNHHSSHDDSGNHHSSHHDSGNHHSSHHDSGNDACHSDNYHSSSHDTGGGTCDSGGGGDSGGGDCGGGDSGGGGGCDD